MVNCVKLDSSRWRLATRGGVTGLDHQGKPSALALASPAAGSSDLVLTRSTNGAGCLRGVTLVLVVMVLLGPAGSSAAGRRPVVASAPASTRPVRAFPGAEGGGALSRGGRGGRVVPVTTLGDSGPGSLRACVEGRGPRTCVFRTGGTIRLAKPLVIDHPYITVAGQTAPGDGVQVVMRQKLGGSIFWIGTHDTTIRYIRTRNGGSHFSYQPDRGSGLEGAYNNILDHVSMEYCGDDCISVSQPQGRFINNGITLSWLLVAESANADANRTAMVLGADIPSLAARVVDVDVHHNFLATHDHRLPKIGYPRVRVVNNIMFNPDFAWINMGEAAQADIIGNVFREGRLRPVAEHPVHLFEPFSGFTVSAYLANNVSSRYLAAAGAGDVGEWHALVRSVTGENGEDHGREAVPAPPRLRRATPFSTRTRGVEIRPLRLTGSGENLESLLLRDGPPQGYGPVGASRRLSCDGRWLARRDALDARVVEYYHGDSGPGPREPKQADLGIAPYALPNLAPGTPCADSDSDGIPDAYEQARCGSATCLEAGALDGDGSGYTTLERYLNGR